MKLSMVMPVYNDDEYLEIFLKSLPDDDRIELIICSDGPSESTRNIVLSSGVKSIYMELPRRIGMYSAVSECLKIADGDMNIWVSADHVFPSYDWISRAWDYVSKDPNMIVIPNVIEPSPGNWVCKNFGRTAREFDYESFDAFANEISIKREPTSCNFGFPFFHRSILEKYVVDTRFDPKGKGWADSWYTLFKKSNIKLRQVYDIVMYHFWNGYQRNISEEDRIQMNETTRKFFEKHGNTVGEALSEMLLR